MAVATALFFLGIADFFATNTAFSVLSLNNQFAAATTDAERAMFLAASLQAVNFTILIALTLAVGVTLLIKEIPLRRTTRWSRADESADAAPKPALNAG